MVVETTTCTLCGLSTAHPIADDAGQLFCCPACREVSELLTADASTTASQPAGQAAAPAATATTTFSVGGLWCPSCAWLIRERLARAPGVHTADVNFIQREGRVTFDPARIDAGRLLRRVRQLGYRAWREGETPHDEEEAHWMRLLVSGVFAMHVMVLSFMLYAREWLGWASAETEWLAGFFQIMILVASVPVVLILGLPILRAGFASLLRGRPNTHTLIALGAFSAFGLSLRNFVTGVGGIYFDTAAILLFLLALGRWFEMRAQKVSLEAVEHLWQQVPQEAVWLTPEGEKRVPADAVPVGAQVRVRPGERFPVDAVVAAGEGDVDESLLTGEPEPVTRVAGDRVLAGTISLDGAFEIVTTAVGGATLVGQIGRMMHRALWQRAPVERLADRLAALMVPAAVLLAALTFGFWTQRAGLETGLIYALSVLLIACPCALGIATPLTLWLGLGRAGEAGIILRNTEVLEQLARVRHVFFDKTGTLAQRQIDLQAVAAEGMDEDLFLAWMAAVERPSEHPLGQAIVRGADQRLENGEAEVGAAPTAQDFRALPGQGVTARVNGTAVWVGNRRLMQAEKMTLPAELEETAAGWQQQGLTLVYAGWHGRVQGILGLGETVRADTAAALAELKALGLSVSVLTGDDAAAGQRWQHQLGIPVYADLRPEDKVNYLQAADPAPSAAMVGDGINDGPALAAAAVGIAVNRGSDVAQAAAGANLLHDDLRLIPWLFSLSRLTLRKVRQNLAWAFVYNGVGLALAVSGQLQPVIAALFMLASNIIVTTNALRLRKAGIRPRRI